MTSDSILKLIILNDSFFQIYKILIIHFEHVGAKNLPNDCLYVSCNLHDTFLFGSRIATLGSCSYSYQWFGTFKLCLVWYIFGFCFFIFLLQDILKWISHTSFCWCRTLLYPSRYFSQVCKYTSGMASWFALLNFHHHFWLIIDCLLSRPPFLSLNHQHAKYHHHILIKIEEK